MCIFRIILNVFIGLLKILPQYILTFCKQKSVNWHRLVAGVYVTVAGVRKMVERLTARSSALKIP
jgi:hypothetical protein